MEQKQTKTRLEKLLDGEGRLKLYPKKADARREALSYLAGKFTPDTDYSEKEVNQILTSWHTFGDYFTLRRDLIDYGFLARERDGSRYWRVGDGEADAPKAAPIQACPFDAAASAKILQNAPED